jgi:hypothetical protein
LFKKGDKNVKGYACHTASLISLSGNVLDEYNLEGCSFGPTEFKDKKRRL